MKVVDYSIIIPVFNTADSLEIIFAEVDQLMKELNVSYEVVFVEDHSTNKESWKKLLDLKKRFSTNITIIKLSKSFGQNGATLCGIDEAIGKMVVTIDDDLQIHPAEIRKLIQCYEEYKCDLVYGIYKDHHNFFLARKGSQFIKALFRKSEDGASIGSSFRLISPNIVEYIRHHSQDHLFINQVISWYTSDIKFVDVNHNPRYDGQSGYSIVNLFMISMRLVFFYSSIPIRIMIFLGVVSAILTMCFSGFYIYRHYAFGEGLGFLTVVVVSISFILASISTIGIYLNRIYSSRVKKPSYAIKIKVNAAQ